jgi:hypothetical protein
MRKRIFLVVFAVSIIIMSSYAMAVKPDSPPGLSKDKNLKAPGHWKKTGVYESQRHFVNEIHSRILSRLAVRFVFPPGLMRLVDDFLLEFGLMESAGSEEKSKVEVSGEVIPSEEINETIRQLRDSLNGTEGKHELKLKVKKVNETLSIERNETEGELTEDQQDLWNYLVGLVESLVGDAEGDDVELEIEIEHELEIEEEEIEDTEPIE